MLNRRSIQQCLGAILLSAVAFPPVAYASDWTVDAHIIRVEPSYIPEKVYLQLDVDAGSCPAGAWLQWISRGADLPSRVANAQAVLATAMTALTAGKRMTLFGNNAGCELVFVHLIP